MKETGRSLYQIASAEIRRCIDSYLELAAVSKGLTDLCPDHMSSTRTRVIVMAGFGIGEDHWTSERIFDEWQRRQAQQFDLETGITAGVYSSLRAVCAELFDEFSRATLGFTSFDDHYLVENPHMLPVVQHVSGVFSKARLKQLVGSVSDSKISRPAAGRIARLLNERVQSRTVVRNEVLTRLESTLEGIVRDLVGRVLLESIVEAALQRHGLAYVREKDYESLAGVVYDFRADFVLPNAEEPMVFIEVRKSSSRHASLYAKDKMFSAINWKGKSSRLLGVLVVDGEWTRETLRVMSNVFDYVVPISRVDELAVNVKSYVSGDYSKLRWIVDFAVSAAN